MKNVLCFVITTTFALILSTNLQAATLSIGTASGSAIDKNISIPVELISAPGEQVSGFNFDLNYDSAKLSFKEVTLGSVAVDARKSLSFSQPSSNIVRVVVIGLNQNVIGDGTVLNFTFDILDKSSSGKVELTITKASISDPKGNQLSMTTEDGEIIVEEK